MIIHIKRKEIVRRGLRNSIGSTVTISKNLVLILPKWAIRSGLVKKGHFYEALVETSDNNTEKVLNLIFIDKSKEQNENYYFSSASNKVDNIYVQSICNKYNISPGKYELEEFDSNFGTGFMLKINNNENHSRKKERNLGANDSRTN